ncbi:hypothetical protein L2E82_23097 [Cichorium intybus]|uniref:Uncharacterized protein n=1 Tax=Cichorium intybus TaxID=13427 RepID=A0ACB9E0A2_CICIN|nr:hypothetical protein L2E82_23097 [Cichorium intybus]
MHLIYADPQPSDTYLEKLCPRVSEQPRYEYAIHHSCTAHQAIPTLIIILGITGSPFRSARNITRRLFLVYAIQVLRSAQLTTGLIVLP